MLDSPTQEIKDRLPILEVLQDYLQLKKAGTNYKGICPFHSEKSASFMVSPSKQIWHCFGCGLGGDIFEFIKQIENVEFPEALKILADRAGVDLKKPTPEQIQLGEQKSVLYEINEQAAKYFAKVLWESDSAREALDYLRKRGLTDQTVKNWNLGWAPDDFHYLENFLAKSFNKKDIEAAGLIIKRDHGSQITDHRSEFFDRFRGRIMFPILNLHGQTVGFTGRLLHEKPDTGKYINSPETPIYNKSQVIYGLYQAKNAIRKENRCILVEGNMDVISCHQSGTQTAVASSGTAFTEDQFRVLARFTENIIFAFDTDTAGMNAARRALEIALGLGLNVKVIDLQNAKDPDELIKRGIGIWQKAVEKASNFVEYFFDKLFQQIDTTTVEGKREITKQLAPLIYRISEPVTRAHFVRKLSSQINVAESAIWDIIKRLSPQNSKIKNQISKKSKTRKEILADQVMGLSLMINDESFLKDLGLAIPADQKELLLFSAETDMKEQGLDPKAELPKVASELKKITLKDKMQSLSEQLASAEKQHNKQLIEQLSREFAEVSSKMQEI